MYPDFLFAKSSIVAILVTQLRYLLRYFPSTTWPAGSWNRFSNSAMGNSCPDLLLGPACLLSVSQSWLHYIPLEFPIAMCPMPLLYLSLLICLKEWQFQAKKGEKVMLRGCQDWPSAPERSPQQTQRGAGRLSVKQASLVTLPCGANIHTYIACKWCF